MKKLLKVIAFLPIAAITFFVSIQLYINYSYSKGTPGIVRQNLSSLKQIPLAFASIPKVTFEINTAYATEDSRPIVINKYFVRYNSPMRGLGEFIVKTADEKKVDPYLIVAIAQQESNLGKLMPENCHNAWGWGIHSAGTLCFESWQEGINTFITGLADKYYAYGLYTPEEIMTKYNPISPDGSWAKGVGQFLEELESGDFI